MTKELTINDLRRKELKYFHFRYMFYSTTGAVIYLKGKVRIKRKNGIFSLKDAEKQILSQKLILTIPKKKKYIRVKTTYAALKEDCIKVEVTIFKK